MAKTTKQKALPPQKAAAKLATATLELPQKTSDYYNRAATVLELPDGVELMQMVLINLHNYMAKLEARGLTLELAIAGLLEQLNNEAADTSDEANPDDLEDEPAVPLAQVYASVKRLASEGKPHEAAALIMSRNQLSQALEVYFETDTFEAYPLQNNNIKVVAENGKKLQLFPKELGRTGKLIKTIKAALEL